MKTRIERADLADIAGWVARSLPQRPSVPVLAGIRLSADGATLTAEGFDYEVSTQASVTALGGEPGTVLVSARLLSEIAKALPNKPVDLSTVGTHLELVCGSARFTLPTMPVEDFPTLPAMPTPVGTIDAAVFAQAVTQTAIAASRDETLPMMTGVRIEISGTTMALLATDRYRLVVRELDWKPDTADLSAQVLIPARTLTEVAKTLAVGSDPITLALAVDTPGEGMIGFEAGGRRMTSRLLDGGNYPPVRSLFPATHNATATVPTGHLVEVVKRVALVAERATPVLLTFRPLDTGDPGDNLAELVVEAGGSEEARASETIDAVTYTGEQLTIGFNPQYIIDGLTTVGGDAQFAFVDAHKPAVITPAESDGNAHRYLLMPIRVQR